jgi:hypothetical protein
MVRRLRQEIETPYPTGVPNDLVNASDRFPDHVVQLDPDHPPAIVSWPFDVL